MRALFILLTLYLGDPSQTTAQNAPVTAQNSPEQTENTPGVQPRNLATLPLTDARQEAEARALMEEIRCVKCQNQSIIDSNADIAGDMRRIVREQIRAGVSPDSIKAFLVERYGDWVLLKPPFKRGTLALWLSPVLFILLGLAIFIRRQKRPNAALKPLDPAEKAALDRLLAGDDDQGATT